MPFGLPALLLACAPAPPVDRDTGGDSACTPLEWSLDLDGDGWAGDQVTVACTAPDQATGRTGDCDDSNAAIHPGATEVCDGVDNDCDGTDDPVGETWYRDADDDGFGDPDDAVQDCDTPVGYVANADDCDDDHPDAHPGAEEIWYDGIDQDCLGGSDHDADGDGADHDDHGGLDCDDSDSLVGPHVTEECGDGVDNDCDGLAQGCGYEGERTLDDADWILQGEEEDQFLGHQIDLRRGVTSGTAALAVSALDFYGTVGGDVLRFYEVSDGELQVVATMRAERLYAGLGIPVHPVADYDGDGLDDVAITIVEAISYDWGGPGRALLYAPPLSGVLEEADADLTIIGEHDYSWATESLEPLHTWDEHPRVAATAAAWDPPGTGLHAGKVYFPVVDDTLVELADSDDAIECSWEDCKLGEGGLLATDLDGDGVQDILVTVKHLEELLSPSMLAGFLGPVSGTVDVLDGEAGLTSEDFDLAGYELDVVGDLDGDGIEDVMIPVRGVDFDDGGRGAIYLYSGATLAALGAVGDDPLSLVRGITYEDQVGRNASHGDLDGDGDLDLVSANQTFDDEVSVGGRAWAWLGPIEGTMTTDDADLQVNGGADLILFGYDITATGDLDGDGCDDLAVGAPNWPAKGVNQGRVGIFMSGC